MSLGSSLTIIFRIHFTLHLYLLIILSIPCFNFHDSASLATYETHSIPIFPNLILIFLKTLLTLSLSYIQNMHLKALIPLTFIHTALFHGFFSDLLVREHFVALNCTEDEVECYFESSAKYKLSQS